MPSSSSTNAPKFVMRTTFPSIVSPTWWREKKSSQMSVASCFRPSDSRWFSASMLSTIASTTSPFFSTSDGCLIRLLHDMSAMWIRPSISSSTSTNAPNSVRLRTLPWIFEPTGYLSARSCHGLVSTCLRPSEILRAVGSTPSTIASTVWPTFRLFDARFQLHERAVVGEAHDFAGHARPYRVAVHHVGPRIGDELLVSQRHAL